MYLSEESSFERRIRRADSRPTALNLFPPEVIGSSNEPTTPQAPGARNGVRRGNCFDRLLSWKMIAAGDSATDEISDHKVEFAPSGDPQR
jgi:hypothetical protein